MNVLVACEFSGVVRDAFRKRGHNAWSCDLLPTESSPQFHLRAPIQRFVRAMRGGEIDARTRHGAWCNPVTGEDVGTWHDWEWDLMIAHPPCTHLAVSGARWFKDKTKEQVEAIRFVEMLW